MTISAPPPSIQPVAPNATSSNEPVSNGTGLRPSFNYDSNPYLLAEKNSVSRVGDIRGEFPQELFQ